MNKFLIARRIFVVAVLVGLYVYGFYELRDLLIIAALMVLFSMQPIKFWNGFREKQNSKSKGL